MADTGQQRSFAKNLKQHSALHIRQSATATVKAMADKTRPKLRLVEPLDYEGELITRRKDLEKEQYLNLLLFPQQDVTVEDEEWDHRTLSPPVSPDVVKEAPSLFTHESLKFYTSKWHRVNYNFSKFTNTFPRPSHDYVSSLPEETFELDLVAEEKFHSLSLDKSGGTPLSKKGYLQKGPFPQDGGVSVSMKNYRKRWFVLSGGPREGGYTLTFYKDEKSNNIKGKIELDTCTEVKKNSRYKQFGFELVTDDERIFYPLGAESDEDLDDWISVLNKALRMEVEETDAGSGTLSSFYMKETMKDPKKIDIRPEMLEHTSTTDAMNARRREKDRHVLFGVYPELVESSPVESEHHKHRPRVPEEKFGLRFLVSCKNLSFKLKVERNGSIDHIEPFFLTFALYDVNKGIKISENFHVDLNSAFLRQMVPPPEGHTDNGPHPLCLKATRATEGIFSVTFPHQDVYLVAKVEKVLQGGIAVCAEPYIKDYDNPKATSKLAQQSSTLTNRLGQHRMPFAWAARPLFTTLSELDVNAGFSPLFRQEREKLSDEDVVKLLSNYRTLHKQKLQVIPGELNVDVVPLASRQPIARDILNSSYLPLRTSTSRRGTNYSDGTSSPHPIMPVLEIREFAPLDAYHPHTSYHPNTTFLHHLYVYPCFLKYDGQKSFAKARNISCCVQFKDSDDLSAPALSVIYCKSSGAAFTDRAHTAVLHHCTSPTFYEEVKIKLPTKLLPSHHLLFTFFHVSCDLQKGKSTKSSMKQAPLETPVGYAWQPLADSAGRLLGGPHSLPVAASLPPGYLAITPSTPNGQGGGTLPRSGGAASPEIKWVENHKPLFKFVSKFDSTIYTLDPQMHNFFMECQHLQGKGTPPSMTQMLSAIKSLGDVNLSTTIQFLPLVLTQLFKLLSLSSKDIENIKPDILRLVLSLVDNVVRADGKETLRTYIEYMFVTEVDSSRKKAVHDELARLLVQYLRQPNQDEEHIPRLLDHLWFFLDMMLKSMAQYLVIAKKVSASRKTRYPEDFGWNLQNMVTSILTHIRENHTAPSSKSANTSLADFVKRTFSFMDRGVVFRIVARYLEVFNIKENISLSNLKLEFIRIICDHEHFIPLNLPFPIASENMEFGLSDEFCRRHFLVGVLLREVETALEYEAGSVRAKTLKILRNLLAKHDCDSRYAEVGQRGRVASLYFPLIPLILNHVGRLDTGSNTFISPMLNAASMAAFKSSNENSSFSNSGSVPGSATGTLRKEKETTLEKVKGEGTSRHKRKSSDMSLDPEVSLTSDTASALLFNAGLLGGGVAGGGSVFEEVVMEMDKLSVEETRDLLISALFILKHLDTRILHHWWQECMGSSNTSTLLFGEEVHTSQFSQLMDFFDLLESCLYAFKYEGHASIARATQSSREMEEQQAAAAPPTKDKMGKKSSVLNMVSSPMGSLQTTKAKAMSRSSVSSVSSPSSSLLSSAIALPVTLSEELKSKVNQKVKVQGALANEVGLIVLTLLDNFSASFRRELSQDEGDNILMTKYFSLLVTFLQVNQSTTLQTHIFALLRAFIYKYRESLYKGSADYCGILCYEILQCCNSRVQTTRTEGTILLYLLMRNNFQYFKGKSFIRTNLQSTIAVSKLVSTLIGQSDANLRRSLTSVATFVSHDDKVQNSSFPSEVKELMDRLKTVLSSTAQMEIHKSDHEKLIDLHYSLAKSYGNSPELRQTWLDSMTALHLKYGNYSEAAQCCIHIAGLVAEYLKIKKIFPAGCKCFTRVSSNVALDESSIKEDHETGDEHTFSERNLVALLESSINYLEQAERYEMMSEVFKLLQPFYERTRDFKHMMEMYGKLHEAYRKVVDISTTGKRYLGTYFRIGFYGKLFGDDHEKQFIYKEPKVTTLAEITLRLQRLYSRKFGSKELVHIIQESGKVNAASLNPEHAYIQITHVEPYFTAKELEERKTKFERENQISRFVFETPFTLDGKPQADVTKQCMRKTILTTSHWFPYVKKRIPVIDQEQFDLTAIQVAVEAMDKKTRDLATVVKMDPPDLKRLQLLLAGSISTQVNQGIQEYAAFFKDPASLPTDHVEQLRHMYRTFMQVCQEALELNARLISTDQLLYHDDLKTKFHQMEDTLAPHLNTEDKSRTKSPPLDNYSLRRRGTRMDPHRMSAILFHSISSSK